VKICRIERRKEEQIEKFPETWGYGWKNGFVDEVISAADYNLEICFLDGKIFMSPN
jgi:hypothetical protein